LYFDFGCGVIEANNVCNGCGHFRRYVAKATRVYAELSLLFS